MVRGVYRVLGKVAAGASYLHQEDRGVGHRPHGHCDHEPRQVVAVKASILLQHCFIPLACVILVPARRGAVVVGACTTATVVSTFVSERTLHHPQRGVPAGAIWLGTIVPWIQDSHDIIHRAIVAVEGCRHLSKWVTGYITDASLHRGTPTTSLARVRQICTLLHILVHLQSHKVSG